MLKDKIAAFIEKIRSIDGVTACALVSRDGIIAGKYFDREFNEPWFGALAATLLASAESAGNLITGSMKSSHGQALCFVALAERGRMLSLTTISNDRRAIAARHRRTWEDDAACRIE